MSQKTHLWGRSAVLSAVAMAMAVFAQSAAARELVKDFEAALQFDPTYQGAKAEYEVGQRGVKQARSVFFPEATFSTTRLPTDNGSRTSFSITQPIIDLERWVTLSQAAPRQLLAEVNLLGKRQDLANRLIKSANAITLAMENIALNRAKMASLDQQAERARRLLSGGQGTVTDLRDIEVRASQAKAQQLSLDTQLQNALKQYQAITGIMPGANEFVLPASHGSYTLSPLQDLANQALQSGPSVLASRYNLQIAEFEVKKIKASFLPTVNGIYSRSQRGDLTNTNQYVGVGFSVPLKAGTIYSLDAAQAGVLRAQEGLRETESRVRLDADRLSALVSAGMQALRIQQDAIAAAELSVEANTKSYQGGVRSAVDVLNAIQTSFQVKSDYVQLATTQAENILSLMLLAATDPTDAVAQTHRYLFAKR
jgi:outer membrane protein TolC